MTWTQPICERCWVERECDWNHATGSGTLKTPHRVLPDPDDPHAVEVCCFCGWPTWCGIFTRVDPKTVSYPKSE